MMSQAFNAEHFIWSITDGVGTITLNRPERKNPLTFDSYAELIELFTSLTDTKDVGAIIFTGAGGNFCSGGDVHEIIGPLLEMDAEGLLGFTQMTGNLVKAMRRAPQPIVAAVDGVCVGAGAIVAMASDLRIATPEAKTAFLFNKVGLSGADMGACAILPRIIGQGRASELLLTGRTMSADEGFKWGFYNRIVDDGADLMNQAKRLAQKLADGPRVGNAVTKHQLNIEWDMNLEEAIDAEAVAQAECMKTNDFRRAYDAFVKKQKPKFEGD